MLKFLKFFLFICTISKPALLWLLFNFFIFYPKHIPQNQQLKDKIVKAGHIIVENAVSITMYRQISTQTMR